MDPRVRTALFLAALTALMLAIGHLIGGVSGLVVAVVFAFVMNFASYFWSAKFALMAYHAKEVHRYDNPMLYTLIEELCLKAELPMPKVYIIPSTSANAFATGRNPDHAAVAVTKGIMDILNKEELKAVLAHELGHIKNRDVLVSTVAGMIAGVIGYIAFVARWGAIFGGVGGDDGPNIGELIIMAIIAPLIALLLQMAISRSREYLADSTGAQLIGHGQTLASALEKLEVGAHKRPLRLGNEGTSHLFIVHPFKSNFIMELLSTHPSIASRVKRLRNMRF